MTEAFDKLLKERKKKKTIHPLLLEKIKEKRPVKWGWQSSPIHFFNK